MKVFLPDLMPAAGLVPRPLFLEQLRESIPTFAFELREPAAGGELQGMKKPGNAQECVPAGVVAPSVALLLHL